MQHTPKGNPFSGLYTFGVYHIVKKINVFTIPQIQLDTNPLYPQLYIELFKINESLMNIISD
jgi:hypothetical protein